MEKEPTTTEQQQNDFEEEYNYYYNTAFRTNTKRGKYFYIKAYIYTSLRCFKHK